MEGARGAEGLVEYCRRPEDDWVVDAQAARGIGVDYCDFMEFAEGGGVRRIVEKSGMHEVWWFRPEDLAGIGGKSKIERFLRERADGWQTYLVRASTGEVKIGKSRRRRMRRRLGDLQRGNPRTLELLFCVEGDHERELHLKYWEKRIGKSEWFNLSEKEIEWVRYHHRVIDRPK